MIKEIKYKQATCDMCGCRKEYNSILILPKYWVRLNFNEAVGYDLCCSCVSRVDSYIKQYKHVAEQLEKKDNTINKLPDICVENINDSQSIQENINEVN